MSARKRLVSALPALMLTFALAASLAGCGQGEIAPPRSVEREPVKEVEEIDTVERLPDAQIMDGRYEAATGGWFADWLFFGPDDAIETNTDGIGKYEISGAELTIRYDNAPSRRMAIAASDDGKTLTLDEAYEFIWVGDLDTEANAPPDNVSNIRLTGGQPFSGGYAWVTYEDPSTATGGSSDARTARGLIDTTGAIVYTETEPVHYTSEIKDGMGVVATVADESRGPAPAFDCKIISVSGEVLYSNAGEGTEADSTYILTSCAKGFLACRYVSNISERSISVGVMDRSGKIVNGWQTLYLNDDEYINDFLNRLYTSSSKVEDLGEGLFQFSATSIWSIYLYDIDANLVSQVGNTRQWLGFHNGKAYMADYTGSNDAIYAMPHDRFAEWIIWDSRGLRYTDETPVFNVNRVNGGKMFFSEGYYTNGLAYYDLEGNELFTSDLINWSSVNGSGAGFGPMSGGLARLVIKGADGKYYVTMVDASGVQQFEPVQVDTLAGYDKADATEVSEDRIVAVKDGVLTVIGKTGSLTQLELPSNNNNGFDYSPVSDGYVLANVNFVGLAYLSADGMTRIGAL